MTERTPGDARREQLREFRRVVAAAVGELRSEELRNAFSALSLEELVDEAVRRLDDSATDPINPSRLQRIRKVRDDLVNNIAAMKETPPEYFRSPDPERDVNTDPEPEET